MSIYEPVIGIEVHAQLLTRSKMFCGCAVVDSTSAAPNRFACPTCAGLPGALPVANRRAVECTIMAGLALNCRIAEHSLWERKNYFYADLPSGYQRSMYRFPLCEAGWLDIDVEGRPLPKRVRIRRVHLEEDTAKLSHHGEYSLVDLNRAGVPLIEIVTEPDLRTPEEARHFLIKLRGILRALGISTADMEKGAMRCEANVSLRPAGSDALGTKVEVKNLNSFRSVKLALEHEIARQARTLDAGGHVRQVTMGWDERRGQTVEQRVKEESEDYRYFPEPDLPPLHLDRAWVEAIRAALPELPDARRERLVAAYGLAPATAGLIAADREAADYYEAAAAAGRARGVDPRAVAHWLTGEVFRLLRSRDAELRQLHLPPEALAGLVAVVEEGTITPASGKAVLAEMAATGRAADDIIRARGLGQISGPEALAQVVDEVLAAHPDLVAEYRAGREVLLRWFMGEVMKATRGKANPQAVTALLEQKLADGRP